MNVSLTPELEQLIKEKIDSGMYHSASEVVRDALRLFKEHDQLRQMRLEELRREIQKGLDQLDRGEWVDGEQAFEELRRMSQARRRKSA